MKPKTIINTTEEFLTWLQVERRFAKSSIISYCSRLKGIVRDIGDLEIKNITSEHIFKLKSILYERQNSEVFTGVVMAAIKGLLLYARDQLKIPIQIDPGTITIPKRKRKDIIYLTVDEINRFRNSININTSCGLRFRALVETLLGSACRISEALSLNRDSISPIEKEARIIGKGGKERVLYFNEDSLYWINKYSETRTDNNPSLFITTGKSPRQLRNQDLSRYFKHQRSVAGISKKVTPHILRHTAATTMAMNNCSAIFIKEILGHSRLQTSIDYYISLADKQKVKQAHQTFLKY
ncbi:MAG: tyrosine-type recombinase/integrase [Parcubacteria group bacterium]|jgi:site-specific recombinase XerD